MPDFFAPPCIIHEIGDIISMSESSHWGIQDLKIPQAWKATYGEGITVAVLDSGTSSHPDIIKNVDLSKCVSFIPGEGIFDEAGHGCVSCNTKIVTDKHGIIPIKQLWDEQVFSDDTDIIDITDKQYHTITLDAAKTGNTSIQHITHIHRTPIKSDIKVLHLTGETQLKLTNWHPVYTRQSDNTIVKKRADDINIGDTLIVPSGDYDYFTEKHLEIHWGNIYKCLECNHIVDTIKPREPSVNNQCKKCRKSKWINTQHSIVINEELGWLLGIILTDGHIVNDRNYRVSIHSTTPEILQKADNIIYKIFGVKGKYRSRKTTSDSAVMELMIDSKKITHFCIACGIPTKAKSFTQRVPNIIARSSKTVISSFIAGVIDGNGCISKNNRKNRIISASLQFMQDMKILFAVLGITARYNTVFDPAKYDHQIVSKKGVKYKSIVYTIVFPSVSPIISQYITHPTKKERSIQSTNNIDTYVKVKNITDEYVDEYFYDLTVGVNATYLADGVFLSNTHVAGLVAATHNEYGVVGVAPKATIVGVKVLNKNGMSVGSSLVDGLDYCIKIKPDVINMSIGGNKPMDTLHDRIKTLSNMGIPVVVSAGNTGDTNNPGVLYPGKYDEVITVSAYAPSTIRSRALFSSYGPEVDVSAPGERILSTYLNESYAIMSGTSQAAPIVAGIVALIIAKYRKKNQKLSVQEIKDILYQNCVDIDRTGVDDNTGHGMIDIQKIFYEDQKAQQAKLNWWQRLLQWFK